MRYQAETLPPTPDCLSHSGRLSAFVVPVLVGIVFCGGVAIRYQGEFYPIANWGMFSQTPNTGVYYSIVVHEINGKAVAPPRLISDLSQYRNAVKARGSVALIKQLCSHIGEAGRGAKDGYKRFQSTRAKVEALFGRDAVVYEPIELQCDPFAFLRDRLAIKETTFGQFKTGVATPEAEMKAHAGQSRAPRAYTP